jgi:hypothetical protein
VAAHRQRLRDTARKRIVLPVQAGLDQSKPPRPRAIATPRSGGVRLTA